MKLELHRRWLQAGAVLAGGVATLAVAGTLPTGIDRTIPKADAESRTNALALAGDRAEPSDPAIEGLVVHEWGTFTTVSGSDGALLPGLEREEEALPFFVHSHAGMGSRHRMKGLGRPVRNVTVKMETPVLYFYADNDRPFPVRVGVGFEGGTISEWFPERSAGEELPGMFIPEGEIAPRYPEVDFAGGHQGSIAWEVDVLPRSDEAEGLAFHGGETLAWVHPRRVDANVLRTAAGTHEKYLFYRGVGNFSLPARFSAAPGGIVRIENTGSEPLPGALVFSLNAASEASFRVLGPLATGDGQQVELAGIEPTRDWHRPVYDAMTALLVEAGLFRKEADAMVQTWWESYFTRAGTRVFWIVPRRFTDAVLPLELEPAPATIERVLVGRAELMTPELEEELLAAQADGETWQQRWSGDRYALAYLARLQAAGVSP